MTVAFDSSAESTPAAEDPHAWTHTPVGTLKGVAAFITLINTGVDKISGVTYGGVAMARVRWANHAGSANNNVFGYFLGASIPSGAQSISVDLTNGTSTVYGASIGVTAAGDTEVEDSDLLTANGENPQITLQYDGKSCLAVAGINSGQDSAASLTEVAGTTRRQEHDFGTEVSVLSHQDMAGTSDFAIGWTATSQEVAMVAMAITEIASAASPLPGIAYGMMNA